MPILWDTQQIIRRNFVVAVVAIVQSQFQSQSQSNEIELNWFLYMLCYIFHWEIQQTNKRARSTCAKSGCISKRTSNNISCEFRCCCLPINKVVCFCVCVHMHWNSLQAKFAIQICMHRQAHKGKYKHTTATLCTIANQINATIIPPHEHNIAMQILCNPHSKSHLKSQLWELLRCSKIWCPVCVRVCLSLCKQ